MKRRSLKPVITSALGLFVLAVGWIFFGPTQVGGTTSYAVVVGNSMEPALHRGDLAIIRTGKAYRPGDVVLYDNRELGAMVLHRIVRVQGGRFVMKGDNNGFLDSEQPTEAQIGGELWASVPSVGRLTTWLHEPLRAALLVGLATLLALGGGAGIGATRRRRRSGETDERSPRQLGPGSPPLDPQPFLLVFGGILLATAALALLAFTQPTVRTEAVEEAYVHQGHFAYSADVKPDAAYPDGRVTTGDPVFLRLVPRIHFTFDYDLDSNAPIVGRGRISLAARLSDGRGWERIIPISPEHAFTGTKASAAGVLDLRKLQRTIDDLRDLTGSSQTAYSLSLLPRIDVVGRSGPDKVDSTFAPELAFDLGDQRLLPNVQGAGVSPFAPRLAGSGTRIAANKVELGALRIPVRTARWLSLIGGITSLLLGLLAVGVLAQRHSGDEPSRIAARYGHLLLPVASRPQEWTRVTDLADFEGLARLAEHHDRMILHAVDGGEHTYVVEESGGAYRYRTGHRLGLSPISASLPPHHVESTLIPGGGKRNFRRGRLRRAERKEAAER